MDKFLFDEAMEDKDNMKTLLDIVLGQDTHLKYNKQFRNLKDSMFMQLMKMMLYMTQNLKNRIPKKKRVQKF